MRLCLLLENDVQNKVVKAILNGRKFREWGLDKFIESEAGPEIRAFADRVARQLLSVDPTSTKKFAQYLVSLYNNSIIFVAQLGDTDNMRSILSNLGLSLKPDFELSGLSWAKYEFVFPTEKQNVRSRLEAFEPFRQLLAQSTWEDGTAIDLNLVGKDVKYLDDLIERGKELRYSKRSGGGYQRKAYDGADEIYSDETFTVYKVKKIKSPNGEMSKLDKSSIYALGKLGLGTDWCTREDYKIGSRAKDYLEYSNVYVIYKNGKPFIQCNFGFDPTDETATYGVAVLDVDGDETTLPNEVKDVIYNDLSDREKIAYYAYYNPSKYGSSRRGRQIMLRGINDFIGLFSELLEKEQEGEGFKFDKDEFSNIFLDVHRGNKRIVGALLDMAAMGGCALKAFDKVAANPMYQDYYQMGDTLEAWPMANKILRYLKIENSDGVMLGVTNDYDPIEKRWVDGAHEILQDARHVLLYAKNIIKRRWLWAEEYLVPEEYEGQEHIVAAYWDYFKESV